MKTAIVLFMVIALSYQGFCLSPQLVMSEDDIICDLGVIQKKNTLGEWYIHIERRDIVETDIEDLSPLEVKQAADILTGKDWNGDVILFYLDDFRDMIRLSCEAKKAGQSQVSYSTKANKTEYP